jgi:DnaJ-class molecular chaperone
MSNEKPPGDRPREKKELYQTCPKCSGRGKIKVEGGKREPQCPRCNGSGQVLKSS